MIIEIDEKWNVINCLPMFKAYDAKDKKPKSCPKFSSLTRLSGCRPLGSYASCCPSIDEGDSI